MVKWAQLTKNWCPILDNLHDYESEIAVTTSPKYARNEFTILNNIQKKWLK